MFKQVFDYVACDSGGKPVRGILQARNEADANEQLARCGYSPQSMIALPGGHEITGLHIAVLFFFFIACFGFWTARPLWLAREDVRRLATEGTQVEARVISQNQTSGYIRKGSPEKGQWIQYSYEFAAPDGVKYRGVLSENPHEFFAPDEGTPHGGFSRTVFPIQWLNPRPTLGETFAVTWHGGPDKLFMPGTFDMKNVNKANLRFLRTVVIILLLLAATAAAYWSYASMGWVSRLFRPITQSRSKPHVLYLRSRIIGPRWFGLATFVVMVVVGLIILSQWNLNQGLWDLNGLAFVFAVACILTALAWFTGGWAMLDRENDRLVVKPGVPTGNPFHKRTETTLSCFGEVVIMEYRDWIRGGRRNGRRERYLAKVCLFTGGDACIFGCRMAKMYWFRWLDDLREKRARRAALEVAARVGHFLDIPVRDTTSPRKPQDSHTWQ